MGVLQNVRMYDAVENELKSEMNVGAIVLDVSMASPHIGYSGGLDGTVKSYDFNTNQVSDLGAHMQAAKCVEYSSTHSMLMTGSWDKTLKLWDPRNRTAMGNFTMPDKVYSMSTAGDKVVIGTAGRNVWIYDLRNMGQVEQRRESSLKFQTRCVALSPTADNYVLSSIDGRVSVEMVDPSPESQKKKYAFKCHREKGDGPDGQDTIYPVNSIAFHPKYGTFASGGCDGKVNIWDGANKKRLSQLHRYPTSISAMAFNHDGSYLAIASSYTYEEGEKEHPADAIFIHQTTDAEVKGK
jgi:cell cycle arrest protein BUB3